MTTDQATMVPDEPRSQLHLEPSEFMEVS
jgi:hypothetical protein